MNGRQLVSSTRPYWSVGVLGAGAVLLLLSGQDSMAAALTGALIVNAFDVREAAVRENQRLVDEEKRKRERRRQDLDETRRVAYIALHATTPNPELLATLVNALAHHGLAVDPSEAANQTASALRGYSHGQEWVEAQIARIDTELKRLGTP